MKSMKMSTEDVTHSPTFHVVTRGMDMTDSMGDRVHRSIGKVIQKLGQNVISTHIVLRIHKYPITGKLTHCK